MRPAIWGNLVVWTDFRNEPDKVNGTNSDIYAYDLNTKQEFPVFVGPGRQDNPKTASGVIAWEDSTKGNSDVDIMGATVSGITLTAPPCPPPILPGSGSRFFPETGPNGHRHLPRLLEPERRAGAARLPDLRRHDRDERPQWQNLPGAILRARGLRIPPRKPTANARCCCPSWALSA